MNSIPAIAALAAIGASSWLVVYWSWRVASMLASIAIVRVPLAALSWISRVGSGADRLRLRIEESAVLIDEETAKREIRWPSIVSDIHALAVRRLGTLEKPSSLARRILRDQSVAHETERGRRDILPSLREYESLIELAIGGSGSLSAFLSLTGSGKLDTRSLAAAVALLAKSGEVDKMKMAAFHLDTLLKQEDQLTVFSREEIEELWKLRAHLAEKASGESRE